MSKAVTMLLTVSFKHLTITFKEKECQAREAEEIRQLDMNLLHQRAIEAEEDKKREVTLSLLNSLVVKVHLVQFFLLLLYYL